MWLLSEKVKTGENDIQSFYINNHNMYKYIKSSIYIIQT